MREKVEFTKHVDDYSLISNAESINTRLLRREAAHVGELFFAFGERGKIIFGEKGEKI